MKKLLIASLCFLFLTGCTSSIEERSFNVPNTEAKEPHRDAYAEAPLIVEKVLEKRFKLANFEVNAPDDTFKVFQMPDDKNAETGEIYMDLHSAIGNFTYQDKIYDFNLLYSMKEDLRYSVIYFSTTFDESLTIDIPLESEQ